MPFVIPMYSFNEMVVSIQSEYVTSNQIIKSKGIRSRFNIDWWL